MDLTSFKEDEIILTAIKAEVDSQELYSRLADGVKNAYLKGKLRFLASEEEKHEGYLKSVFNDRFPGREVTVPDKTIVPLPELRVPDEKVLVSDVIDSAMHAELVAQEFYNSFAEFFDDKSEIKNTLQLFATMELGHFKILEIEKENIEKFEEYDDYWPMMHIGT